MVKIRVLVMVPQVLVWVYDISTVPADMAVIKPVPDTMVARAVLALAQEPPGWLAASVWVGADVGDIVPAPTIAADSGSGLTVSVATRLQPLVQV